MKGTSNKKLVPELRFPEFGKDWDVDSMQSIFDMKNGYTPSKSNPTYWDNGTIPWFRMEDIRKNGHILSDSIQHVTQQAVKNSGLFPAYSIIVATTATIGEHALIIVDSLANQRFTFLTKRKSFKDKINMMYFHHYMFIIDEWCKKNTNSGGLVSVNMPTFKQLLIPFPSPGEQQKIAECLSSIDEEISAIKEKVEQLKGHKKGLMQKLFPIAGKSVPELRFSEFEKEWKEMSIADCCDVFTGGETPKSISKEYSDIMKYPIYANGKNVYGYTDSYRIDKDAVCISSIGANAGAIFYYKAFFTPIIRLKVIIPKDNTVQTSYLYYFLTTRKIKGKKDAGIPNLNANDIKIVLIMYPSSPAEQQKIAECLSSIDELISLYENKVILMEQHKTGLMQRLFPKL